MERIKLAPKRKRPRRVARKIGNRNHVAHYRDVQQYEALTGEDRCDAFMRIVRHMIGPTPPEIAVAWTPEIRPGQPTPDGTARIDSVRITVDSYAGMTCAITSTPIRASRDDGFRVRLTPETTKADAPVSWWEVGPPRGGIGPV
jgi:hypothetical protein